ncbi:hypothetical protein Pst134EA_000049 [Puccinia striiformis f. sp. tritici]|uniref:Ubiquitin-related modifier 1 n=4 Tax=Puccinia striiformis TaxID=27350 RepID=A0A0L0UW20_9BASI|nr:hypothetical protein Pst134EA_000049 [Puccinia striiformis f. sp. tritici]KAI9601688.1 hypothetical protein H4Q26_001521 [Puccinia striiformis f. sp. tritici PST-130]KNE91131.1 hypothetical protein PSTG_15445 [Puccinia striiformis f. sp. tritici PST-78]POW08181.1 hypothetical protein PSHT_09670 [Puccinia striiformis]KAH9466170.1 hypothetical protein Pst134EB_001234 [Puccinia striiformis f. sp. tritici]KAH9472965.1 hypothetical protein Pst134EA_000049 [Puccinia striiformis f. sp. tritici]
MPENDGPGKLVANESLEGQEELIDLKVEFSGGLESLFSHRTSIEIRLPKPHTIQHLVTILSAEIKPTKSISLFCSTEPEYEIKPGILPLVNDEDWELLEPSGMKAILKHGDNVMFISTLHGG